jgi:hypothetical protein
MSSQLTIIRLLASALLVLLAGGLLPVRSARAAGVVYVVPGGAGTKDGGSWANAKDLQPALVAATVGDQIWVAAGRYMPSATDRNTSFALKSGVAIYGGFARTETQLAQRNATANVTTLSGDLAGNDGPNFANNSENSYHVVTSTNTDSSAILDGFTISGGNANILTQYPLYLGGGIYNRNSGATLRNLIITGNHVIGSGGVIYNEGGALTLLNLTVSGNRADVNGGGLVNQGGALVLVNLVISGNSAGNAGGGMYNYGSSPALTNVTVSGNSASQGGGAYNDPASSPVIRNSIFWGDIGGEIYKPGGVPQALYSIVQGGASGKFTKDADHSLSRRRYPRPAAAATCVCA